ncbi:hypothetical protein AC579_1535 [Pseudocercospora musae]|uniref:Uncharacterized protein n=1 Tax=Pseudocercospora musae TaxID=113226 RepID=A0A139ILS1_9PEZI|nr:hypothetical protein AC579_1535 [Pseudocercospora musae]
MENFRTFVVVNELSAALHNPDRLTLTLMEAQKPALNRTIHQGLPYMAIRLLDGLSGQHESLAIHRACLKVLILQQYHATGPIPGIPKDSCSCQAQQRANARKISVEPLRPQSSEELFRTRPGDISKFGTLSKHSGVRGCLTDLDIIIPDEPQGLYHGFLSFPVAILTPRSQHSSRNRDDHNEKSVEPLENGQAGSGNLCTSTR